MSDRFSYRIDEIETSAILSYTVVGVIVVFKNKEQSLVCGEI